MMGNRGGHIEIKLTQEAGTLTFGSQDLKRNCKGILHIKQKRPLGEQTFNKVFTLEKEQQNEEPLDIPEFDPVYITRILLSLHVEHDDVYCFVGINDLTPCLRGETVKNNHANVAFRFENLVERSSTLEPVTDLVNRLESAHEAFQKSISSIVEKRDVRVIGAYSKQFARMCEMLYMPSAIVKQDGGQALLPPPMHFQKHRSYNEEMLETLAGLAVDMTVHQNGNPLRNLGDSRVPPFMLEPQTAYDHCMRAKVLVRYLAILANVVKYESDYNFDIASDKKPAMTDIFGDSVVGMSGDCEDASRVILDVWRSTLDVKANRGEMLYCLKEVQAKYDIYAALCTIRNNADMAHCTTIIVPKQTVDRDHFPFCIVEGTNTIDPFGATRLPDALAKKTLPQYVEYASKWHAELLKKDGHKNLPQSSGGEKFTYVMERPTAPPKMARVCVGDDGGEGGAEGRANHNKSFYGAFMNLVDINGTVFVVGPKDSKQIGSDALELEKGEFDKTAVTYTTEEGIAKEYSETFGFINDFIHFDNDLDIESSKVDDGSKTMVLPVCSFGGQVANSIRGAYRKISINNWHIYVSHVDLEENINQGANAAVSAVSARMVLYDDVMKPFGAAANRPLYPSSDASLCASVAARFQKLTGERLSLKPHVPVGELVRAATGTCMGNQHKGKHHMGERHMGSRHMGEPPMGEPPMDEPPMDEPLMSSRYMSHVSVQTHPISGPGDLIVALQQLKLGEHDKTISGPGDLIVALQQLKMGTNKSYTVNDLRKKLKTKPKETHIEEIEKFLANNVGHPLSTLWEKFKKEAIEKGKQVKDFAHDRLMPYIKMSEEKLEKVLKELENQDNKVRKDNEVRRNALNEILKKKKSDKL
jgi:hypothetical protein